MKHSVVEYIFLIAVFRSHPKLICRAPVEALERHVHPRVIERVRESTHYKRRSDSVMTTSDDSMSTNANRQECLKKLRDIFRDIAEAIITEDSRKLPKQL